MSDSELESVSAGIPSAAKGRPSPSSTLLLSASSLGRMCPVPLSRRSSKLSLAGRAVGANNVMTMAIS